MSDHCSAQRDQCAPLPVATCRARSRKVTTNAIDQSASPCETEPLVSELCQSTINASRRRAFRHHLAEAVSCSATRSEQSHHGIGADDGSRCDTHVRCVPIAAIAMFEVGAPRARRPSLLVGEMQTSDVDLLRNLYRIVDLDGRTAQQGPALLLAHGLREQVRNWPKQIFQQCALSGRN